MTTPVNQLSRRWLLIAAVAAVAVALVLAGALIAVALTRPDTPTTPAAGEKHGYIATPAASPTRDGNGEAACMDLEKQQAKKFEINLYASELSNIATVGMQATDEDVREQSEALWDLLKRWGKDSNINGLDVERQVLNLIRACDDANYAF